MPEEGLPIAMKLEQTGWNVFAVGGSITAGLLVMLVTLTWLALDASVTFLVAAGYVGRHRLVRLRAG